MVPFPDYFIQVVNGWTNSLVDPDDEFGNDSHSECGNSWSADFMTNGSSGLRYYSFSGQYYYLGWCIFPLGLDHVSVTASQGGWVETDTYNSHTGTHSEYDIDMEDSLQLQVIWLYY